MPITAAQNLSTQGAQCHVCLTGFEGDENVLHHDIKQTDKDYLSKLHPVHLECMSQWNKTATHDFNCHSCKQPLEGYVSHLIADKIQTAAPQSKLGSTTQEQASELGIKATTIEFNIGDANDTIDLLHQAGTCKASDAIPGLSRVQGEINQINELLQKNNAFESAIKQDLIASSAQAPESAKVLLNSLSENLNVTPMPLIKSVRQDIPANGTSNNFNQLENILPVLKFQVMQRNNLINGLLGG